jgi:hypothetical protein
MGPLAQGPLERKDEVGEGRCDLGKVFNSTSHFTHPQFSQLRIRVRKYTSVGKEENTNWFSGPGEPIWIVGPQLKPWRKMYLLQLTVYKSSLFYAAALLSPTPALAWKGLLSCKLMASRNVTIMLPLRQSLETISYLHNC